MIDPTVAVRLARPCHDLAATRRFYVDGLGLEVLWEGSGPHDIVMLGWPRATWHLELVAGSGAEPAPTEQDLLVLYLAGPVDEALVERLVASGGTRVAQGDYWDRWGVTLADPDGYRLVLSTRSW